MSYIFPRRALRASDVLDPIELTMDFSPAAERLSGRLNAHNIDEGVASTIDVEAEALTQTTTYALGVPFGIEQTPTLVSPWTGWPDNSTPADAFRVQNNHEWQHITSSVSAAAEISVSTGQSVMWVHAYAQYLWQGFDFARFGLGGDVQHKYGADEYSANVQFALRLDGTVLQDTITGIDDLMYRTALPAKAGRQRDLEASPQTPLPGAHDPPSQQVNALGPAALPVRISAAVPVQAGDHTIELVVRRVPRIVFEGERSYETDDRIYIYSRQITAMELKSFPVDSVTSTDVTVPAFEEEDPINHTTMYVERVQPLIAAYNDVQEGNVQRGALMHYHLPQVLQGATQDTAILGPTSGQPFNSIYPGFGSTTIAPTPYLTPQTIGWSLLDDGSDKILTGGIQADVAARHLILANVQIPNVDGGEYSILGAGPQYIGGFAVFCLMWRVEGTVNWNPITPSEAMVNSFACYGKDVTIVPEPLEFVEVELMAELPLPALAAGSTIEVAVFGSVLAYDFTFSSMKTEFTARRGNIIVISARN